MKYNHRLLNVRHVCLDIIHSICESLYSTHVYFLFKIYMENKKIDKRLYLSITTVFISSWEKILV